MDTALKSQGNAVYALGALNYVSHDPLPRDVEQSHRLHEPTHMLTNIDPITANDIDDLSSKPFIIDGNVTMYFESEATREAYLDTPSYHPFQSADNPDEDGEAEG